MEYENIKQILKLIKTQNIQLLSLLDSDYWLDVLDDLWSKKEIDAIRYLRKNKLIKDIDLFELSSMYIDDLELLDKAKKIIEIINENALDDSLYISDSELINKLSWRNRTNFIDLWRHAGASFDYMGIAIRCFYNNRMEHTLFNYLLEHNLLDSDGLANVTVSFLQNSDLSLDKKNLMLHDMINRGLDLNYHFDGEDPLEEYESIPGMIFCFLIDFYNLEQSRVIDLSYFENCSWELLVEHSGFDEKHFKFVQRLKSEGLELDLDDLRECLIDDNEEYYASLI